MERDEAGALAALKSRRQDILQPLVSKHHGRIVKLPGDGVRRRVRQRRQCRRLRRPPAKDAPPTHPGIKLTAVFALHNWTANVSVVAHSIGIFHYAWNMGIAYRCFIN
jgi:class 3 adenylate cyclase